MTNACSSTGRAEPTKITQCQLRLKNQTEVSMVPDTFQMTELSPTARHKASTGQVVSMLAVDCYTISMSMFLFPMPLAGIICMPVVLYLLAERVGTIPTLCCTAWFLLALILPFPTSRIQKFLWVSDCNPSDFIVSSPQKLPVHI